MLRKLLSPLLVVGLFNLSLASVSAGERTDKETDLAEQARIGIAKLGVGPKVRVEVRLKDGTVVKGVVTAISDDRFSITDSKTGALVSVAYTQVKQVKGHNLSTGAKTALGIAVLAVVAAAWFCVIRGALREW